MLKLSVIFVLLYLPTIEVVRCAEITGRNAKSGKTQHDIAANYVSLLNDLRWFFRGLERFSTVAERLLPNVTLKDGTRTFTESTRINILQGLRHIATGTKEVSSNFRRSLEIENVQQVHQIKQATNFIHEVIKTLKEWFAALRVLVAQIMRLVNRYMPEVLLGKCLGGYIIEIYPNRIFYEYPFLLLSEITLQVWEAITRSSVATANLEITHTATQYDLNSDVSVTEEYPTAQNEIAYNETDNNILADQQASNREEELAMDSSADGFFNLYDVILEDKQSVIESAIKKHSWKKCFKLYTAESIVRKLKFYFLDIE